MYLEKLMIVIVLSRGRWANNLKPWYIDLPLMLGKLLSSCRLESYNAYNSDAYAPRDLCNAFNA